MTLLFQATQEYLKDRHTNWEATITSANSIYIKHITQADKLCDILINTHLRSINVWDEIPPTPKNPKSYGYRHKIEYHTEHTILQQITEIINQTEKQINP